MSEYEIREVYEEDTIGRKYHPPIVSKKWTTPVKEEEHGEVFTLRFDRPMSDEEFQELNNELKSLYLKHLKNRYNVSMGQIADMLGIHYSTLKRRIENVELCGVFPKGNNNQTKEQEKEWEKFLNVETEDVSDSEPEKEASEQQQYTSTLVPNYTQIIPMRVSEVTFKATGILNVSDISKKISSMIDDGTVCEISVSILRI